MLVLPPRIFSKTLSGKIKMTLVQIVSQIPSALGEAGLKLLPKSRANVKGKSRHVVKHKMNVILSGIYLYRVACLAVSTVFYSILFKSVNAN